MINAPPASAGGAFMHARAFGRARAVTFREDRMAEFAIVAVITILAVISPGPDFVMVSRNSLTLSRQAGVLTAIGIGLGVLVHVAYVIVGVGLLLQQSEALFFLFKMAGAAYLIWMGISMIRSSSGTYETGSPTISEKPSNMAALRMGILTNALNPKCSVFILSLFMQIVSPNASLQQLILYGLFISATHIVWFMLVAYCLSAESVRKKVTNIRHWVDRCFGALLVALGITLATMAMK